MRKQEIIPSSPTRV